MRHLVRWQGVLLSLFTPPTKQVTVVSWDLKDPEARLRRLVVCLIGRGRERVGRGGGVFALQGS